jgi:chorismate synthase
MSDEGRALGGIGGAGAVVERFGGDSIGETRRNIRGYLDALVIT